MWLLYDYSEKAEGLKLSVPGNVTSESIVITLYADKKLKSKLGTVNKVGYKKCYVYKNKKQIINLLRKATI